LQQNLHREGFLYNACWASMELTMTQSAYRPVAHFTATEGLVEINMTLIIRGNKYQFSFCMI